ncbi:MAG: hypothetical protein JNM52_05160 [Betaproteobacteria bacterium]|nr:hypothetical protein [Betaproteobacteria bacterium]
MKKAGTRAHIRQLTCLGYSSEAIMPALLRAIRELVPCDSAGFFWTDRQGNMTGLYAERVLPPGLMNHYFEHYYRSSGHDFQATLMQRVQASESIVSVSPTPDIIKSAYYNEIMRPLEAHHILYGTVRDPQRVLGQLSLYRPKGRSAFNKKEMGSLRDILHYISHAVRSPQPGGKIKYVEGDEEAIIIVDRQGNIARANTAALNLLLHATVGSPGPQQRPLEVGQMAPAPIPALIEQLTGIVAGRDMRPPMMVHQTPSGRFVLRAYALGDTLGDALTSNALIGIHVRRYDPYLVKFAESMHDLQIPPQQREVAILLAQGKTNPQISETMGISQNTVNSHVRSLFAKLDARDRAGIMNRILSGG